MFKLNEDILKLFELFAASNKHLYIVGGAVRDYYLGLSPYEFDFATDATPIETLKILKDYKTSDYRKDIGLIIVSINNNNYEITTFRKDIGVKNFRYPERIIFIKDLKEDAKRRDFTINALYYNPIEGVIDPTNGLNDLENKELKFIGDSIIRIKEDPLRMIRCLRFSLFYDLQISNVLINDIKEYSYLIKDLDNVKYKELFKIIRYCDNWKKYKDIFEIMFKDFKWNDNLEKYLLTDYLILKNDLDFMYDSKIDNKRLKNIKKLLSVNSLKLKNEFSLLDDDMKTNILKVIKELNVDTFIYYSK